MDFVRIDLTQSVTPDRKADTVNSVVERKYGDFSEENEEINIHF